MEKLSKIESFNGRKGPVLLCIMDGVGYGPIPEADAVAQAHTPTLDKLLETCPNTKLKAHGVAVGMPSDGDMGNSEVGHNAIGCGRVFSQGATLVEEAINSGRLFEGSTWRKQIDNVLNNESTLHLIGLLSDGNVHSHVRHCRALIQQAKKVGVKRLRVHTLIDGRDVGETSALEYIEPFEDFLAELNADGVDYRIASGGGRMHITMDRYDADWPMVERGWNIHVHGKGEMFASAKEAIEHFRTELSCIDQDLPGFVIAEDGEPVGPVKDNDSVIFTHFRGDRAIEISKAFEMGDDFDYFDRGTIPNVIYSAMMEYDGDLHIPKNFLVEPPAIDRTIGEYLANEGVRQFAISETQKYGHVTYFFNGNRTEKFDDSLEDYVEITSDLVPFEERPWMKGAEICDEIIKALREGKHQFYRINFPHGDMVGHTGNFLATMMSVETVDLCLARILPEVEKAGGVMVITADHGNADEMYEYNKKTLEIKYENGKPKAKTNHTLNPVPAIIYDPGFEGEYRLTERDDLGISSLTATCLNLLGYNAPDDYDPSLIEFD